MENNMERDSMFRRKVRIEKDIGKKEKELDGLMEKKMEMIRREHDREKLYKK